MQKKPYFILFIGVLAVSSAAIMIKVAQREVTSEVIAFYRLAIAGVFYALYSLALGQFSSKVPRSRLVIIAASGLFLALHFITWIKSLEYTDIMSSVVLVSTTPFWVALLSKAIFKEKISRKFWIGLVIALLGVVIINLGSPVISGNIMADGSRLSGNLLALAGALCMAGYTILSKKARAETAISVYAALAYSSAALFVLLVITIQRSPLIGFSTKAWVFIALIAIFPQIVGHTSFNWALKFLPASISSIALLGEPVGSSLLALLIFQAVPGYRELFGGLLVLAGIAFAVMDNTRSAKRPEASDRKAG